MFIYPGSLLKTLLCCLLTQTTKSLTFDFFILLCWPGKNSDIGLLIASLTLVILCDLLNQLVLLLIKLLGLLFKMIPPIALLQLCCTFLISSEVCLKCYKIFQSGFAMKYLKVSILSVCVPTVPAFIRFKIFFVYWNEHETRLYKQWTINFITLAHYCEYFQKF